MLAKRGPKIRFNDEFHIIQREIMREHRKGGSLKNVYCSNCKRHCYNTWNFCPECGASLDLETVKV